MKIIIQPKQHHESKMTPDELQEYLKMCRSGTSATKNGRAYQRKPKYFKRLSYCWDFFSRKKSLTIVRLFDNLERRHIINAEISIT